MSSVCEGQFCSVQLFPHVEIRFSFQSAVSVIHLSLLERYIEYILSMYIFKTLYLF